MEIIARSICCQFDERMIFALIFSSFFPFSFFLESFFFLAILAKYKALKKSDGPKAQKLAQNRFLVDIVFVH